MAKNSASSHNLTFLHGWGTSPPVWKNQIEHFSKEYKVEAPPVIASDCEAAEGGPKQERSNLHARRLLRRPAKAGLLAMTVTKYSILIGWSYGGMRAMQLAAKGSTNSAALVLMGATAKFVDEKNGMHPAAMKKLKSDLGRDFEGTMKKCYRTFFSEGEQLFFEEFINGQVLPDKKAALEILCELQTLDLRKILKDIHTPTLIIHGDKDEICPIKAGEFLHRHIGGSRFEIIKGAGHAPFYTRPDEVNKILGDFLGNVSQRKN